MTRLPEGVVLCLGTVVEYIYIKKKKGKESKDDSREDYSELGIKPILGPGGTTSCCVRCDYVR